jgi:hypothetical protein
MKRSFLSSAEAKKTRRRQAHCRSAGIRPILEALEDRTLLSHGFLVEDFQLDWDPTQPGVASSIFQHSRTSPMIVDYSTALPPGPQTSAPHALSESDSLSVNVVTFSGEEVDYASVAVNAYSQFGPAAVQFVGTHGTITYREPAPPEGLPPLPTPPWLPSDLEIGGLLPAFSFSEEWVVVDTDPAHTGVVLGQILEVRLGGQGVLFDDLTIHVASTPPANAAPSAGDDEAVGSADTPIDVAVLANDSDPDGHSLTITHVSSADHGNLAHNGEIITYTPNAGFRGIDTFEYTVDDGNGGQTRLSSP